MRLGCADRGPPRLTNPADNHGRPRHRSPPARAVSLITALPNSTLGRSRGGLSTKLHAVVDALGNPIGFHLTGGEAHDLAGADALLPDVAAATVIADRGYDAEARVLAVLREAGKVAVIPPKRHRTAQRDYDRHLYGARYLVEHFFNRLKQYRAIATRYDKTKRNFLAAIHLVASAILLN